MSLVVLVLTLTTILLLAGGEGRTLVVAPEGPFTRLADALALATDGDTIEVHGGVHAGPLVVERAVALVGRGRPVLDGLGRGTVLSFGKQGGEVRGFLIRGSGNSNHREDAGVTSRGPVRVEDNVFEDILYGIDVKAGRGSVVRSNRLVGRDLEVARRGDAIRLWESHGSVVEGNDIVGLRDVVIWYSEGVRVLDNVVRDGRYGLHFMNSSGSTVLGNVFQDNAVGAYAMYSNELVYEANLFVGSHGPSGYGMALKDSDAVLVRDNAFVGNRTGLYFDNSPHRLGSQNEIHGNTIAFNDIGLAFMPAVRGNVLGANNLVENFQQVALMSGGDFKGNDWTPDGAGNYWSGYAGYDADGDGFGDLPYQEVSLFNDLVVRHPQLRLFRLSPAQMALDLAARTFPVFRPAPILTDTAPRVSPAPTLLAAPVSPSRPLAAVSLGLLVLALGVGLWGAGMDGPAGRWSRAPRLAAETGP